MVFHDHNLTLGVDHERATFSHTVFSDEHFKVAAQDIGRVTEHRELNLTNGRGASMPGLVGEVGVGRNRVDFNTQLLEFFVRFSKIFQFSRADKREVSRIEEDNRPVTLQISFSDWNELAIMESFSLKRLDFGIK